MKEQESSDQAKALLKKYLAGQCTAAEEQQVLRWFYTLDQSDKEQFQEELPANETPPHLASRINARLDAQLFDEPTPIKRLTWMRSKWMVAALMMAVSGFSFWLYQRMSSTAPTTMTLAAEIPSQSKTFHNDILPGGHYAKIITPTGKEQQLADPFVQQHNPATEIAGKNFRVDVPKAGTYMVILEDGTKVWLNSLTQLSYPTHFEADQRQVTLTGEAYFKVAKDASRPFRINANGTTIEVLGTTFNVNAYEKEVSTSLVEGSVKIVKEGKQTIIKPGEQATTLANDIQVKLSDLTKNTAWQREEFYFDGNNFNDITQQIARWYNVEFENIEAMKNSSTYKGSISRNSKLSEVLQILALATGRKFDINGRKVLVQ
ncbi:FecR domain-containing protein [Sphingobacterium sp.]|uniref:FecR domain-containing protein n=1 Tax=Sphingobacterium sp. TaxID=341027 RepID=UPI0028B1AE14|nr:FecR domain-containing protein [Sphingobacterium sp.]